MTIGEYIGERARAVQLTQRQLAERLGISEPYMSDIIHDRRPLTQANLIHEIAAALWINADVLFYHAGLLAPDMCALPASDFAICEAFAAFRRKLAKEMARNGVPKL